jgi:predicted MFS family arabinose efflux permease
LYAGFGIATLGCALAPNHHWLFIARMAAGAFGGLAFSMVMAMVGDIIPPTRRGRAMSWVGSAFPVALVVGVPLGLVLAGRFGWHAPFYFVAAVSAANLAMGAFALPHIRTAVHGHEPLRQMREIVSHRVHLRAFSVTIGLAMAGGMLIPFIAPSFVANVGLSEDHDLPLTYVIGGIATALSTPIIGWLCDRIDRLRLLTIMSCMAVVSTLVITRLGPTSFAFAATTMAVFMVTMSGRFTPAMTMITNAVEARYRGGFMSVNSALQQATVGFANVLAGVFVTRDATGHLVGLPWVGAVSIAFFVLTVLLAAGLRAAAPHVAAPAPREPEPVPSEAAI